MADDDVDEAAAFWAQVQREAALANPGPTHAIRGGLAGPEDATPPLFEPSEIRLGALGWLDEQPPPQRWLLEEVMPEEEVVVFGGAGASSKSQLLLQVAVGVASGAPIADGGLAGPLWRPVMPRPVLLLTAEDKDADIRRRLWRIAQHGIETQAQRQLLLQNLYVKSVRGMDVRVMFQERRGGEYLRTKAAKQIEELAGRIGDLGLVIMEPVSRFRGGDEIDNTATTAQVAWMERLSEATQATVATTAHVNKFSGQSMELDQDAIRGASALAAGARWVAAQRVMTPNEAEKYSVSGAERRKWVRLAVVKGNNIELGGDSWLERGIGGYLMHRQMKGARRDGPSREELTSFDSVLAWVARLLRERPGELLTVSGIETKWGGVSLAKGGPGVGQKKLRQILRVALDDGALRTGPRGRLEACVLGEDG